MRCLSSIAVFLVTISVLVLPQTAYAQPSLPKDSIPPDTPTVVREQIQRLYSRDVFERRAAATRLGELGELATPAAPYLLSLIDDVGNVSEVAFVALGKIRNKAVVKPLIELLTNPRPGIVYIWAALALDMIDTNWRKSPDFSKVFNQLLKNLQTGHYETREKAARALGATRDPRAVEALVDTIRHRQFGDWRDTAIRDAATFALGEIRDPRAVDVLLSIMQSKVENEGVLQSAGWALGKIRDIRVVGPLIEVLQTFGPKHQITAADALGEIGDSRAVRPLILELRKAMKKKGESSVYQELLDSIVGALKQITGQDFGYDAAAWESWWVH